MFGSKKAYVPNSPDLKEIWDEIKAKYPRMESKEGIDPKELYLLRKEIRAKGMANHEQEIIKLIISKSKGI